MSDVSTAHGSATTRSAAAGLVLSTALCNGARAVRLVLRRLELGNPWTMATPPLAEEAGATCVPSALARVHTDSPPRRQLCKRCLHNWTPHQRARGLVRLLAHATRRLRSRRGECIARRRSASGGCKSCSSARVSPGSWLFARPFEFSGRGRRAAAERFAERLGSELASPAAFSALPMKEGARWLR